MLYSTSVKKSIGSMIGLAIGDALGAPVEFLKRGSFEPIKGYQKGGKFKLSKGDYTDDTAMALCLADSLIKNNGCNLYHQLDNYIKWLNEGYMSSTGKSVGCGKNTYLSLLKYIRTGEDKCGNSRMKKRAGNGSLMRIAPVAIFYKNNIYKAMYTANESSYTTHGLKICADACMLYTGLIVGLLNGATKEEILSEESANYFLHNVLESYEFDEVISSIIIGSYKDKDINSIKSGGYVADSLEAALWCFYNTENFTDGVFKAVNLGYDSDTVGAIYGMIAGAYYGLDGIDMTLRNELTNHKFIEQIAIELSND